MSRERVFFLSTVLQVPPHCLEAGALYAAKVQRKLLVNFQYRRIRVG